MPALAISRHTLSGRAWSPLYLGDALVEWWDARTSASLTLGGGNAISNVAGQKSAYALVQATGSLQAIWDASGLIKFDATNDYFTLTLTSAVAQGQMYFVTPWGWFKSDVSNWTAVTHRINAPDVSQLVLVDSSTITVDQRAALEVYLGDTQRGWVGKSTKTEFYNRFDNTPDVNYTLDYKGANAAVYSLASSQGGATVNVGTQGLTSPVAVLYPVGAMDDATQTVFTVFNNTLIGPMPSVTNRTALQTINYQSNSLSGPIADLSANINLQSFTCTNSLHTGSIPDLSANINLQTFSCGYNLLRGSIPDLSANVALVNFTIRSNAITGSIPSLAANVLLQTLVANNNSISGSIPSFSTNVALLVVDLSYNSLSGSISSLAANVLLQSFVCNGNQLTGYTGGGVSNTLATFNAASNLLPAAAINAILADFVAAGRFTGTLTLNGTGNAAPTGQGITDKATLQGMGWTVNTN